MSQLSTGSIEAGGKKHLTNPLRRTNQTMENSSRRRNKKIIICICGMSGCGKSTLAKKIAEKYGLRYASGGNALKVLALESGYKPANRGWWETDEGMRFLSERMRDSNFDKKVDQELIELAKKGNVVLDSWTMPWLLEEGFKVWIEASPGERAERLAKRDNINIKKALNAMNKKDEKTRAIYRSLYGFSLGEDFSPFNLILDTDVLGADEVFQSLSMVVDRMVLGKSCECARN